MNSCQAQSGSVICLQATVITNQGLLKQYTRWWKVDMRACYILRHLLNSNLLKLNFMVFKSARNTSKYWNIIYFSVFLKMGQFKNSKLYKKWRFPLRIPSVAVTKSTISCGFSQICWRNSSKNFILRSARGNGTQCIFKSY